MFKTKAASLQSFEHSNIMSMVEYRPWKIVVDLFFYNNFLTVFDIHSR